MRSNPRRIDWPSAILGAAAMIALVFVGWYALVHDESGDPLPVAGAGFTGHVGGSIAPSDLDKVVSGKNAFEVRFKKPPRSGLVMDLGNGEVLWRLDPLQKRPIASLTKIMTALLVAERTSPAEKVRITRAARNYEGSGVGVLPKKKPVTMESLLNGLMIVSGNDAAIAIADHVSGSTTAFADEMNARAEQLDLDCTSFVDPHGLAEQNVSCAWDLARLARKAIKEPRIARVVNKGSVVLRFPIKGGKLYLTGHNPLIRDGYPGAIGLKTGYTDPAGHCFVGIARRNGRTIAVVLLHSPDIGKQARKLLDAAFRSQS